MRADAKKAPAGAQANDASVARDAMPTNAAPQAPRTMMSAASMSARGQATSGSTRRAQTAMSRGLNAAATNDVRPSEGSSLRYSFRTWNEQPSVELRFDSNLAAQTMTAHASHDRVANAMQQHASLLSSDVTLRFERQQADDQGKNPHGSNEQQDAEEQ
ncbi:hypothetical protein WS62_29760 [Burkholderia sp. ABCPW 14]|nr:hypothetical protein WS62_29760 [Burkholderia sp. ABCPW 14]